MLVEPRADEALKGRKRRPCGSTGGLLTIEVPWASAKSATPARELRALDEVGRFRTCIGGGGRPRGPRGGGHECRQGGDPSARRWWPGGERGVWNCVALTRNRVFL